MEPKAIRQAVETRSSLRYEPEQKILEYFHRRRAEGAPKVSSGFVFRPVTRVDGSKLRMVSNQKDILL